MAALRLWIEQEIVPQLSRFLLRWYFILLVNVYLLELLKWVHPWLQHIYWVALFPIVLMPIASGMLTAQLLNKIYQMETNTILQRKMRIFNYAYRNDKEEDAMSI